jgi:DNA-binding NarL/FixJ family response regulator
MEGKDTEIRHNKRTRLLIADDHWVVVEGVKAALEEHREFEVVGTVCTGAEAVEAVQSLKPDIVILDISMPSLNGLEAAREIKKCNHEVKIIIFSMYSDKEYVLALFDTGISGYVLKDGSLSDLVLAAKSVRIGGTYLSPVVQQVIQSRLKSLEQQDKEPPTKLEEGMACLSAREKEVFPLLADGFSAKEIASRLGISPKTAESHKYNIMDKLNVTSVAQLTKIALSRNLIKL